MSVKHVGKKKTVPSEFLTFTCNVFKMRKKNARTRCDWFWFYVSLAEKITRDPLANHQA